MSYIHNRIEITVIHIIPAVHTHYHTGHTWSLWQN